jgi:hypothetical protein
VCHGRELEEKQRDRQRVAEEKQRARRPEREAGFGKPSDLFRVAGVPACRGVHLDTSCLSWPARKLVHLSSVRPCPGAQG